MKRSISCSDKSVDNNNVLIENATLRITVGMIVDNSSTAAKQLQPNNCNFSRCSNYNNARPTHET